MRITRTIKAWAAIATLMSTVPVTSHAVDPVPDPEVEPECLDDTEGTISSNLPQAFSGETVTLAWSYSSTSCAPSVKVNGRSVSTNYAGSGQVNMTFPAAATSYKLTAEYNNRTRTLASVTVGLRPEPVLPVGTNDIFLNVIDGNEYNKRLFKLALDAEGGGKHIHLPDGLELDLTGYDNLPVAAQTMIFGTRSPSNPGPLVYTTQQPWRNGNEPLFSLRCNDDGFNSSDVTFRGFRIKGPNLGQRGGDENLEKGISIESCTNIVIDNVEMFGWSGQAIYVTDPHNRIQRDDQIKISNTYFHHNQHFNGNGYGVESKLGARLTVERSIFDHNRHAIAAGGENGPGFGNGTSYVAMENLVLRGGGIHQLSGFPFGLLFTHQFDVHGTRDCAGGVYDQGCGTAGYFFRFAKNSFQFKNDNAIKVRGNPTGSANAAENVFAHGVVDGSAVGQTGNGDIVPPPFGNITNKIKFSGNRGGVDSYGKYAACDFDHDGYDDLFLATGVTWWFSSGAVHPWTYLNTSPGLQKDLLVGDFDGDGLCDVVGQQPAGNALQISRGGRGPWEAFPGQVAAEISELRVGNFDGNGGADLFRRRADGQWQMATFSSLGWQDLQSSGIPLADLQFGDFNGDGTTDVLGVVSGKWHVSYGGTSNWEKLNASLGNRLSSKILVGDVTGNGIADVLSWNVEFTDPTVTPLNRSPAKTSWTISVDGTGPWRPLGALVLPYNHPEENFGDVTLMNPLIGRFIGSHTPTLLIADRKRVGHHLDYASKQFRPISLFNY